MDNKPETIRKIQVKRVLRNSWEMVTIQEMTLDEAVQETVRVVKKKENDDIFAIRISKMVAISRWIEEFSGDRHFNYIGVAI